MPLQIACPEPHMSKSAAEFDIVVFGASGFTGRLVAEYLAERYPASSGLKWAMAGRSLDKLAAVRDEIKAPASTPLIAADSADAASLTALTKRTKVVLTTVGPYQIYGEPLVAACAETGTDYVDLCGEPAWMRHMIDRYDAKAKASGARIVFSCGFDSIPFDLGVQFLQEYVKAQTGAAAPRVKGRVRKMKGTFSGGTAASLKETMKAAAKDPSILELLKNPFSLAPGFDGPKQPHGMKPEYDDTIGMWVAPFVMAAINTRNVHRTNALLGHAYGRDFVYDEMVVAGPGEPGKAIAEKIAGDKSMMKSDGPKPGEGPGKPEREAGHFDVLFVGITADGRVFKAGVTGDKDPGYGCTSKMIAESALCLVHDVTSGGAGVTTPATVMGAPLLKRLAANAGMTFKIE
jgi:short subunit dehydrogenase-like uncharacterized protein